MSRALRGLVSHIFLYLRGLCIGATGALQGISGGSMALLFGIHGELVHAVRAIDRQALKLLLANKDFGGFWKKINGNFLFVLLAGIATGVIALHLTVSQLYRQHPILITSFFFSLVVVAALLLLRKVTRWRPGTILCFVVGFAISYAITRVPPLALGDNALIDFFTGLAAGTTLILPGVSGAYILMFFGKYQYILNSFATLEYDIIILFIAGSIAGMMVVARVVAPLLTHYFNTTVTLLAGLMIGSLNKVWPWREVIEFTTTPQGRQIPAFDKSVLPWRYLESTGKDPQLFYAVLMMASGVLVVVIIEKIAARLKTKG